jgi:hypothetical protein
MPYGRSERDRQKGGGRRDQVYHAAIRKIQIESRQAVGAGMG